MAECIAQSKMSSHLVLDGVVAAHGGHILRHGGLCVGVVVWLLSDGPTNPGVCSLIWVVDGVLLGASVKWGEGPQFGRLLGRLRR